MTRRAPAAASNMTRCASIIPGACEMPTRVRLIAHSVVEKLPSTARLAVAHARRHATGSEDEATVQRAGVLRTTAIRSRHASDTSGETLKSAVDIRR